MEYLVANWKMNLTSSSARALAESSAKIAKELTHAQIWLAPSFPLITPVAEELRRSTPGTHRVRLGGQHVHWDLSGAFTGEVSVEQLRDASCDFVIVGHSERRQLFGETSETAALRTKAALQGSLSVIFCIGETAEQRKTKKTNEVLASQLGPLAALLGEDDPLAELCRDIAASTSPTTSPALILAYEPVWAIGTGRAASLSDIGEAHGFIAGWWKEHCKVPVPPVLYGGSVSPENFFSILKIPLVSGALVGKASLTDESFAELAKIADATGR